MKHILVYGKTLFLTGLMTQLQNIPDVQAQKRETLVGLNNLDHFDAVLIDLSDGRAADVLALLRARPDLRVVGVNAATGAMTVLQGQVYLAESVEEVTRTICDFFGSCGIPSSFITPEIVFEGELEVHAGSPQGLPDPELLD